MPTMGTRKIIRGSGMSDETWSVKPPNQTHHSLNPSLASNSEQQGSELRNPSKTQNFTNSSRRGTRNRHGHVAKAQYVKKSEPASSNPEASSLSKELDSLKFDQRVEGKREKEVEEKVERGKEVDGSDILLNKKNIEVREEGSGASGSSGVKDDIFGRVEELRLQLEEPELSEEQLQINDRLQGDELLAMESIYGDNFYMLDLQLGLQAFQIHIDLESPSEFTVSTILNLSNNASASDSSSENFSYSFKAKYLPPIILTCLLPKSYPSHLPPCFTISVQWLDFSKVSQLCSMLDSLWIEQSGQEVVYQWVEWLNSSSLNYLGLTEEINLGPYGTTQYNNVDRRALLGCISPDIDIPTIKRYNDERFSENFSTNFHECSICLSEHPGCEFARLPCQHFFCWKCMETYSKMHVKEGTVNKLHCPTAKCEGMIPPGLLKRLLDEDEFERWESLTLTKSLESMSDMIYCPRCETPCIEDGDEHAQCFKCFFSFCTLCREKRHVGITCMTPDMKLIILQERQNSSKLKEGQKCKEREIINELLSTKEILRDAKQCPSCKMAISRTEGCNKMVCSNCNEKFCYCCNKAIDGYLHFREGGCELFPQVMIREWEERVNECEVLGQIQAGLSADHVHPCPNCSQFNAKVGNNNHIFCWACQVHYCYVCRKIVKKSSQHYGPKGCKQHTAD